MLILSRQENQIIRIGDVIKMIVLNINENQVRIGIAAPKEIAVHREEVYRKIKLQERGLVNDRAFKMMEYLF